MLAPPFPAEPVPLIAATYVHWLTQEAGLEKEFPQFCATNRRDDSPYLLDEVTPLLDASMQRFDGVELGLSCPLATHGSLGFAVLTGSTVWNSVLVLCQHFSVRARLFSLVCERDTTSGTIELVKQYDLGSYEQFLGNVALMNVLQLLQSLLPRGRKGGGILHLPSAPNEATRTTLELNGWTVKADRHRFAISIKHHLLDRAPAANTSELHSFFLQACTNDDSAWRARFAPKVAAFVNERTPDWPDLSMAARHFAMSRSTLVRRLSDEGLSYGGLVAALKLEFIGWNLVQSEKPLYEISSLAGFSDQSSFSRFFKQKKGISPQEFRSLERARLGEVPRAGGSNQSVETDLAPEMWRS